MFHIFGPVIVPWNYFFDNLLVEFYGSLTALAVAEPIEMAPGLCLYQHVPNRPMVLVKVGHVKGFAKGSEGLVGRGHVSGRPRLRAILLPLLAPWPPIGSSWSKKRACWGLPCMSCEF